MNDVLIWYVVRGHYSTKTISAPLCMDPVVISPEHEHVSWDS